MNTEKIPLENENKPSCLAAVSGSLISKQIKWHGELQTIIDVHECGYVVMTNKSIPNGVNLHWDSVELLNCH